MEGLQGQKGLTKRDYVFNKTKNWNARDRVGKYIRVLIALFGLIKSQSDNIESN